MIRLRDNMSRFLGKSKDNRETKINVEKNLVELKKINYVAKRNYKIKQIVCKFSFRPQNCSY